MAEQRRAFRARLAGLLGDELKASILLIDRRNNVMNYLSFVMPHVTNRLFLPLGLYKKIFDERETLGEFREWRFGDGPAKDYRLSPPEFLVHLRDTCFHLDQFLETPSDTAFNRALKDAFDALAAHYAEALAAAGLAGTDLEAAKENLAQVFGERFASMYNKSLTSFQLGNLVEGFLSLFMSNLASNPFFQIEGLFRDESLDLGRFKALFYEHRAASAEGELAALPVRLKYFFRLEPSRRRLV